MRKLYESSSLYSTLGITQSFNAWISHRMATLKLTPAFSYSWRVGYHHCQEYVFFEDDMRKLVQRIKDAPAIRKLEHYIVNEDHATIELVEGFSRVPIPINHPARAGESAIVMRSLLSTWRKRLGHTVVERIINEAALQDETLTTALNDFISNYTITRARYSEFQIVIKPVITLIAKENRIYEDVEYNDSLKLVVDNTPVSD